MAPVPNGVYAITKPNEQLLTLLGGASRPGSQVVLLPPTGQPGEQEWEVAGLGNGNVTIKNLRSQTYLSFDGEPEVNKLLGGFAEPRQWVLRQSSEHFTFHIVVPGGPIDGSELVVDLSLLRIYPPLTALRPIQPQDVEQAWHFEFHE
ncbi:hypothetical protein ACFRMQ_14710 [Kitasatospora sp. NPDC056783]|uniref:hypothetical protein n=1 Tax=Kitasatospora sp. NPDC056783 TaxID=3345943 RepID=UPI0036B0372E